MRYLFIVLLVVVAVSVSGCRTMSGLTEDVENSAGWMNDKLSSQVDKADKRDSERKAKWLSYYQAKENAKNEVLVSVNNEIKD